tara:strand:+ start:3292 stop:3609 length:318 start_codon:yes stop_codon:yes gene_type:complete
MENWFTMKKVYGTEDVFVLELTDLAGKWESFTWQYNTLDLSDQVNEDGSTDVSINYDVFQWPEFLEGRDATDDEITELENILAQIILFIIEDNITAAEEQLGNTT